MSRQREQKTRALAGEVFIENESKWTASSFSLPAIGLLKSKPKLPTHKTACLGHTTSTTPR